MRNKLTELNTEVQKEIVSVNAESQLSFVYVLSKSTAHLALFPEEMSLFMEIFNYLAAITADEDLTGVVAPGLEHVEAIINVLDRWPATHRFPGTLSITRVVDRVMTSRVQYWIL
jgi:hypothetical protein